MPPRCYLDRERALHDALRGWIAQGAVRSAHDCSEGGLAVALAECCISQQIARHTPEWVGAAIDLSGVAEAAATRLDALLFGETQGRVILSASPIQAPKILAQAAILGIPAARIGTLGGDRLSVLARGGEWSWDLAELHDLWWNSIARAMA
jgi:phosphoribosylformylglycinamidine synthase